MKRMEDGMFIDVHYGLWRVTVENRKSGSPRIKVVDQHLVILEKDDERRWESDLP